ncbi:hypothetical protein J6590_032538 [Homalodisca vitripennis]|nr:hypothetical protein J6590_032538 [Homalodisca vitripennis]
MNPLWVNADQCNSTFEPFTSRKFAFDPASGAEVSVCTVNSGSIDISITSQTGPPVLDSKFNKLTQLFGGSSLPG